MGAFARLCLGVTWKAVVCRRKRKKSLIVVKCSGQAQHELFNVLSRQGRSHLVTLSPRTNSYVDIQSSSESIWSPFSPGHCRNLKLAVKFGSRRMDENRRTSSMFRHNRERAKKVCPARNLYSPRCGIYTYDRHKSNAGKP